MVNRNRTDVGENKVVTTKTHTRSTRNDQRKKLKRGRDESDLDGSTEKDLSENAHGDPPTKRQRKARSTVKDVLRKLSIKELANKSSRRGFQLTSRRQNKTYCRRCRAIDFKAIFRVRPESLGPNGLLVCSLDYLSPIQINSKCAICRLFAQTAYNDAKRGYIDEPNVHKPGEVWCLYLFNALRFFGLSRTASRVEQSKDLVLMLRRCDLQRRELMPPPGSDLGANSVIALVKPDSTLKDQFQYSGRVLRPIGIDYTVLCNWIDKCCQNHKACALKKDKNYLPKKLVDCETRTIIAPESGMRYCTLSYVWGTSSCAQPLPPPDEQGRQLLPKTMPQTLSDALQVVLELGERYIWIDRYCIDQRKDSPERNDQFAQMDSIFESSVACIVATGQHSGTGLPGVSTTPRITQTEVNINGLRLVSGLETLQSALQSSTWLTRGWTYQEAHLSPRMIFFTESQTYFMCKEDDEAEAIIKGSLDEPARRCYTKIKSKVDSVNSRVFPGETPRTSFNIPPFLEYLEGRNFLEDNDAWNNMMIPLSQTSQTCNVGISSREQQTESPVPKSMLRNFIWSTNVMPQPALQIELLEYTERNLANDGDALNAFRGLLNRKPNISLYGIPLFITTPFNDAFYDLGFAMGLAWAQFVPVRIARVGNVALQNARRHMFPTWSWASVKGTIGFALAHECESPDSGRSPILMIEAKLYSHNPTFGLELEDGSVLCLRDMLRELWRAKVTEAEEYKKSVKSSGRSTLFSALLQQSFSCLPEISRVLTIDGYKADVDVGFPNAGIMVCRRRVTGELLTHLPDTRWREEYSIVNLYMDNPIWDLGMLKECGWFELVLLLRKTGLSHNFETNWWLLVFSEPQDGERVLSKRVGLVRSWSLKGRSWPLEAGAWKVV
jgi:hypothetical protein